MNRIQRILVQVRDSLADPYKERWSDERLLRIMSEGQKDIARQTRLLKDELEVPLVEGQATYDLPEDLWLLIRVVFNNRVIPLLSHEDLDRNDNCWFTRFGRDLHALVYDKRNLHKIRVFPIPNDEIAGSDYQFKNDGYVGKTMDQSTGVMTGYDAQKMNQLYGVLANFNDAPMDSLHGVVSQLISGAANIKYHDPNFGIVTSIDGDEPNSPFGGVTDIEYTPDYRSIPDEAVFSSEFGAITRMRDLFSSLKIYYIKDAPEIQLEDDNLVVPQIFDTALKYYVIAKAYADDIDTQYQTKSDRSMIIYQREIDTIGRFTDTYDGTRSIQYKTTYRSAF